MSSLNLVSVLQYRLLSSIGRAVALATAAVLASPACASEPKPLPAAVDPSNPQAPESPRPVLTALATPPQKDQEKGKQEEKALPAVTYTCPMHPEVVSDKPGRCPKCGMKLVPKEPATPGGKK